MKMYLNYSLCSINIREDVCCLMFIFVFLINIAFELFTIYDCYLNIQIIQHNYLYSQTQLSLSTKFNYVNNYNYGKALKSRKQTSCYLFFLNLNCQCCTQVYYLGFLLRKISKYYLLVISQRDNLVVILLISEYYLEFKHM